MRKVNTLDWEVAKPPQALNRGVILLILIIVSMGQYTVNVPRPRFCTCVDR